MSDMPGGGPGRSSRPSDALLRWAALTLVGAGALCAALALSPTALLVVTGCSAVFVVAAGCTGAGERRARGAGPWLRWVALGTAVLVSAVGVLSATGWWGSLLWAGLLGVCWCLLGRPSSGPAAPSAARPSAPATEGDHQAAAHEAVGLHEVVEDPGRLSDEDLRRRWRSSYLQVRGTTDPGAVARLARARQAYLDELQRRHPGEFEAWLGSASNAARYLAGDVASVTRTDDGPPWPSALTDREPGSDAA
ncbi:hypothetical protein [Aquipuribacter hungaricus]|uniref:DUF4129 domain-containing protein n=1 Tax=Aquipuribacter hungaricus TaxID=545624 RepID=A0ABV7WDP7_9MICO